MSNNSQNNLKKAHEIKRLGYRSLLDAQPEVTKEFMSLWQDGYSLRKARDVLLARFPTAEIPSINALNNYLKNHSQDTNEGRKAAYAQRLREFDSLAMLYDIAEAQKAQYEFAKRAKLGMRTLMNLLRECRKTCVMMLKIEGELGLRLPNGMPNPNYGKPEPQAAPTPPRSTSFDTEHFTLEDALKELTEIESAKTPQYS